MQHSSGHSVDSLRTKPVEVHPLGVNRRRVDTVLGDDKVGHSNDLIFVRSRQVRCSFNGQSTVHSG